MRFWPLAITVLAGCASSSGVVQTGKDTFLVTRSEKGFATTGLRVKADSIREAGEYCLMFGKVLELVRTDSADMAPFRADARAEVEFKCVPAK